MRALLALLLLAGPLLGQAANGWAPIENGWGEVQIPSSVSAPSGLTSGRVTLSTGATSVGDDAGCTWTGTGNSFVATFGGGIITPNVDTAATSGLIAFNGVSKIRWTVDSFQPASNGLMSLGDYGLNWYDIWSAGVVHVGTAVESPLFSGGYNAGGTDTSGTAMTLAGRLGTGAGIPGSVAATTGYPGTTGTTPHVPSFRAYTSAGWTTLTESTDTAIATLTYGPSIAVGVKFFITIEAADATDRQSMSYEVQVNSSRKATGNTQTTVGVLGTPPVASGAGTLTATFTVTEGASAATLNCNAVSSLTQTILRANFQSISNGAGLTVAPVGF